MALYGTITGKYEGWTYRMYWTAAQSVANNTSTITIDHWLDCANAYDLYIGSRNNAVTVDGEEKTFTSSAISTGGGASIKLGTTTHVVKHNDNGQKSCNVSGQFNIQATLAGVYKSYISASGTITLDTIARASQPSCITYPDHTQNVGSFGDTISIHMNRKSSEFTHTVRYAFGDQEGTIDTNVGTGTTWKIPESLMNLIPNNESGSGTIYVDTYNGSTKIGTKWCGFTATVPASVKPTCKPNLDDIMGIDDIYGSPVQGLSKIKVTANPTLAYSSPIKTYEITIDGLKYSKAEITTDFLTKDGTSPVTVIVTDNRGRSNKDNPWTFNMNVQAYTPPAITKLVANRCNADGTPNKRGDYVKVTFSAVISGLGNKNTASYVLKYKKTSESDDKYTPVTLSALANKYTPTDQTYIFEASKGSSYDVVLVAVDRHNSDKPATKSTKAPTALSIFSWRGFRTPTGIEEGAGIGKIPEKPNTLQVGWDAEFEKEVYYKGKTLLDYFYPVGSIYTAYNHTNPGTLFGGTWERIEEAFLWATGSGTIGQTGGEKTHTLTVAEMPSHTHNDGTDGSKGMAVTSGGGSALVYYDATTGRPTTATGGGQAHNNMPPYIQVSMWRRTA